MNVMAAPCIEFVNVCMHVEDIGRDLLWLYLKSNSYKRTRTSGY